MSYESSKALKALCSSIKTMREPCEAKFHVENSKSAIKDLKIALEASSLQGTDLLAIIPVASVASILVQITNTVEKIHEAVSELSHVAHFKKAGDRSHLLRRGIIAPVRENAHYDHIIQVIPIQDSKTSSEHKEIAMGGSIGK